MKFFWFIVVVFVSEGVTSQSSFVDQLKKQQWSLTESEKIIDDPLAKQILSEGEKNLFELAKLIDNNEESKVFSKCKNRNLTVGETAMLLIDHIDGMPYFLIFDIQNCTMEKCPDNPNFVEYYFYGQQKEAQQFKKRYLDWLLHDKDRWKYKKGKARRKTKELIKQWKLALNDRS